MDELRDQLFPWVRLSPKLPALNATEGTEAVREKVNQVRRMTVVHS